MDTERLLSAVGGIASATAYLLALVIVGATWRDLALVTVGAGALGACVLSYAGQLMNQRAATLLGFVLSWGLGLSGAVLLALKIGG